MPSEANSLKTSTEGDALHRPHPQTKYSTFPPSLPKKLQTDLEFSKAKNSIFLSLQNTQVLKN